MVTRIVEGRRRRARPPRRPGDAVVQAGARTPSGVPMPESRVAPCSRAARTAAAQGRGGSRPGRLAAATRELHGSFLPAGDLARAPDGPAAAGAEWTGEQSHLTGQLLVATPQIGDGVFRRSVVLLLHHDDDGAQGVVLNKPLEAEVDAVLPGWQKHVTRPAKVFQGGPVALDSALGIVTVPGDAHEPLGVRRLFGGVGLVDLDVPPTRGAARSRACGSSPGYAGWSPGQLEGEIEAGLWFVVDAEARDAFTPEPAMLWRSVLRRQREPRPGGLPRGPHDQLTGRARAERPGPRHGA